MHIKVILSRQIPYELFIIYYLAYVIKFGEVIANFETVTGVYRTVEVFFRAKTNLSLCLMKHHAVDVYRGGLEV